MARFRLFGRPAVAAPDVRARGPVPHPPPGWGAPPPVGAGAPWPVLDAGPATRSARPAAPRPVDGDPPTDPFGFPPVPAFGHAPHDPAPQLAAPRVAAPRVAAAPGPMSAGPMSPGLVPAGSIPPPSRATPAPYDAAPDAAEAGALAGAFAVDYLSWDEDDPARRGRVLTDYLAEPGQDPARLGWSGRGRQRAEFALPGRVRLDGDGRVLVDVRVRVTPYRSVGEHAADAPAEPEPDIAGVPATAPAPTGRGWRSLASYWIRISVPVILEGGRLIVDAWEETLGETPAPPTPPGAAPDEHTLADDDPLAEPRTGGAW